MGFQKNINRFIIGLLIMGFTSCDKSSDDKSLTISEEKMVDIMMDLRIMENQIKKHHVLDRDSVTAYYKDLFFQIHDIDSASLTANIKVLQSDPRLAKKIEDDVLKKISDIMKAIEIKETSTYDD
jgi:hypothetical protein